MLASFFFFLRRHFGLLVVLVGALVIATAPLAIGNDGLVRSEALDTLRRTATPDHAEYSLYGPHAAAQLWYLGEAIGYPKETLWVFNRVACLAGLLGLWLPFVAPQRLEAERYIRLAAFALGLVYLASPVVRVLAVRAREGFVVAWGAARAGPRWRFGRVAFHAYNSPVFFHPPNPSPQ